MMKRIENIENQNEAVKPEMIESETNTLNQQTSTPEFDLFGTALNEL